MEYNCFQLNNNEIKYQSYINNLLITPYNNGICVNFSPTIAISCPAINGIVVKVLNYIIYFENNTFTIGVSNNG
jgi:hypothetical protein